MERLSLTADFWMESICLLAGDTSLTSVFMIFFVSLKELGRFLVLPFVSHLDDLGSVLG